jgi:type IV secretory pathway VirJ component
MGNFGAGAAIFAATVLGWAAAVGAAPPPSTAQGFAAPSPPVRTLPDVGAMPGAGPSSGVGPGVEAAVPPIRRASLRVAMDGPPPARAPFPAMVLAPKGRPAASLAILISDEDGWSDAAAAAARALVGRGAMVAGVTLPSIAGSGLCVDLSGPLGDLAAGAARAAAAGGAPPRLRPTLVGLGAAGSAAGWIALAQGMDAKGLVTAGFDGAAPAGRSFCGVRTDAAGRFALPPKAPALWIETGGRPEALAGVDGARVAAPPPPGDAVARLAALSEAYASIAGADGRAARASPAAPPGLGDLPVTVHLDDRAPPGDTVAVFLSGDGGWARFDAEVADRLAAAGLPVVGVSALRYLWRERPPPRLAADMARLAEGWGAALGRRRVVLIGYSLGANVTPFYAPLLPPALRERLAGIVLLAPEARTGFEFHPGGWLGLEGGDHDVGRAIAASGVPTLCLHGTEEGGSPCASAPAAAARAVAFPGGHDLGGDWDGVAAAILAFATGQRDASRP